LIELLLNYKLSAGREEPGTWVTDKQEKKLIRATPAGWLQPNVPRVPMTLATGGSGSKAQEKRTASPT
jgi:hypothetical protein